MLTAESIQTLSRRNVSVDGELTKQRAKEALKSATRKQKNEIDALAGLQRVSINRVYATGNISAKIVVAIAQILNIDPFYLTGEADEQSACSDDLLNSFLTAKGYADLVVSDEKPVRKQRGRPAKQAAAAEPSVIPDEEAPASIEPELPEEQVVEPDPASDHSEFMSTDTISAEEATLLFRALFAQAKYSAQAKDTLKVVLTLLVFSR